MFQLILEPSTICKEIILGNMLFENIKKQKMCGAPIMKRTNICIVCGCVYILLSAIGTKVDPTI